MDNLDVVKLAEHIVSDLMYRSFVERENFDEAVITVTMILETNEMEGKK